MRIIISIGLIQCVVPAGEAAKYLDLDESNGDDIEGPSANKDTENQASEALDGGGNKESKGKTGGEGSDPQPAGDDDVNIPPAVSDHTAPSPSEPNNTVKEASDPVNASKNKPEANRSPKSVGAETLPPRSPTLVHFAEVKIGRAHV